MTTVEQTIIEAASFLSRNQNGGNGGNGPATGGAGIVDAAIESVLGAKPENGKDFEALLVRAFETKEYNGRTELYYRRPSTGGLITANGGGALTGAQATIVARATASRDAIYRNLDPLQPLELVPDEDQIRDVRALVHTTLDQVVVELSYPGGPNIDRVDQLLSEFAGEAAVLGNPPVAVTADTAEGLLGRLRDVFGMIRENISSVRDEQIFTTFGTIVSDGAALVSAWIADRVFLDPLAGGRPFLGTQIVQIERGLSVVVRAVEETRDTLVRAEVERAETELPVLSNGRSVSLGSVLDWVEAFGRTGADRLRLGGQDGIASFAEEADTLDDALGDVIASLPVPPAGTFTLSGVGSTPVRSSLTTLQDRVREVRTLALRLLPDVEVLDVQVALRRSPLQADGTRLWPGLQDALVITGSGFSPAADVVLTGKSSQTFPSVVPASDEELLVPITAAAAKDLKELTVSRPGGTPVKFVL
ncbi:hypothetical protein [Symbioplanes lichenis]|uniref:hypothetical protein n=1 Tax=Symbioplanes lichenis TaxID=1629072 RepID=UPI0027397676|nr:hypothetical protein [Actinoplanes lichenis]